MSATQDLAELTQQIAAADNDFRKYVGYVMLDIATADRDRLEPALAHTIHLADRFGIRDAYMDVARKELRMRKRQVQQIADDADMLMESAAGNLKQNGGSA